MRAQLQQEIERRQRLEATLARKKEKSAEESALLDSLIGAAPVGFAFLDRELRYRKINTYLAALHRSTPEKAIGKTIWDVNPTYAPRLEGLYRQILETGEAINNLEVSGESPLRPGEICHWIVTYYPVYVEGGPERQPIGVGVISADITERKRAENRLQLELTARRRAEEEVRALNESLEHRVQLRTAELNAANQELETFSYSVSHDLRAPLRAIDGFSQILLERSAAQLDEQGRGYLLRVRNASQRMGYLIDDLLQFSRVSRSELKLEKVNLGAMAQKIIADLRSSEPDRQVFFRASENLWAHCDPRLLRIALENLLRNAWKFTSRHSSAIIEFSSRDRKGVTEYLVRDDGAGFDMNFADKLFGPFQRLHDTKDFPGTGIGLSTVQRIVHRHGGLIRAEGEPEKGALFTFTLSWPRGASHEASPV